MYPNKPFDDHEMVALLQSGDEVAFERLYKKYSSGIFKKLLRLVKNREIAEELLQDVFLRIWQNRESIVSEKSFSAYLFRITQNLVIDLFRRIANDRKLLDHLINATTELYDPIRDKEQNDEINETLMRALDTLPPQRKKVYTLCKLQGKSYQEVSEILGISVSTVSDHIVKATKSLRSLNAASAQIALIVITSLLTKR